ncbi:PREDICTED: uncharacterized protein LOC104604781 isoform X2 [Nelumbo nucifera]|uniref:Uncharacterized protein LOC104604781 isoform X2 n=1 Tax=Nelumbo nucifera TaxID=4432 RepID=A0A1U8AIR8_NELNU|nr:PREDICTED: uncharacterized protein LOC104604781 isoform X2 [Nelumbo nucifera]
MATLLIPTPPSLFSQCRWRSGSRWSPNATIFTRAPTNVILLRPPLASLVEDSTPSDVVPSKDGLVNEESEELPIKEIPNGGCKTCGRAELEKGCNGEGRIQGGIATVPGFGWWPIKAYRPCPGFVASGGRYRRQGQSMDEVAFGRGEREASMSSIDDVPSSEKKQGPRRFKR